MGGIAAQIGDKQIINPETAAQAPGSEGLLYQTPDILPV